MNYKKVTVTCKICNTEYNYTSAYHKTQKTCTECLIKISHETFPEDSEYVECKICSYRARDLTPHLRYKHCLTPKEYKETYNVKITKVQSLGDAIKGDKNPAYNHGGKFSPFSKNFIKYTDDESYQSGLESVKAKSSQTIIDHPENQSTKIEYYISKGYSKEESEILLSERQSTFSLSKCIERHGEDEGLRMWKERQEKWQSTLNSKSKEEIEEINRKKASSISFGSLWNQSDNKVPGIFYLIQIDDHHTKIGITTKTIKKRYGKLLSSKIKLNMNTTINNAFMIEQVLKQKLKEFKIKPEEAIGEFGWTETFRIDSDSVINIINSIEDIEKEFKLIYDR